MDADGRPADAGLDGHAVRPQHLVLGRRRPFIFTGTLVDLVFIAAIGFSAGMSGMAGYAFLFVISAILHPDLV